MEFSKDGDKDSSEKEETNWAIIFAQLIKHYGLNVNDILNLSYPQFKALYSIIFEPSTFNVTIPYMGSSDKNESKKNEIKQEENAVSTKEGLLQMIASANEGWK